LATPLKVLVVDDEQLTLEMIGVVLTTEGVNVLGLRDPREAAVRIEKEKFDGIFLDLTMPRLNGLELIRQIRGSSQNAKTPIVVITGRGDSATMNKAFAAGAHFFLPKPLDLAKIRHLLNTTRGTMLRERRRFRRVAAAIEISCRAGGRSFAGVTSEISEEGLVFRLVLSRDVSVHPGQSVRLSFRLPGSVMAIDAACLIQQTDVQRHITGRFQDLDRLALSALRHFVASVPDDPVEGVAPAKGPFASGRVVRL
jgi:CheY-like chemotaxis protein